MHRVIPVFALGLIVPACSSSPDHPVLDLAGDIPRHYQASFTHSAPRIDGALDDAAWRDAPWTANFVALEGSATSRPRYQSRAKVLWDRQNLYVGVWMVEPNLESAPVSSLGFDGLMLFLTRDAESMDYRQVTVEPGGRIVEDHFRSDDGFADAATAEGVVARVALSGTLDTPGDPDRGWWVEVAVPWSSMQLPEMATIPSSGSVVHLNLSRKGWAWSPHYQHDLHDPAMWGLVELQR
jgi:hypothetical protein